MSRRITIRLLVIAASILPVSPLPALEMAPDRYPAGPEAPEAFVPYKASASLTEPNPRITRLLFSIHSSGFDALEYFENARIAAEMVDGALPETLIIAPQFFEKPAIPGTIPEGLLYWRVSPFRGSSRGAMGPTETHVGISAFDVLDHWLTTLTTGEQFPQLKDVVIVGHSGGGQLVQRYALVGKFEPKRDLHLRFVVSAPSSYAYPTAERYHIRRRKFVVPDDEIRAAVPKYNDWGYGLEAPYGYFADADPDALARRYAERCVFYLCGANDNDPNDETIGKSDGAMMQGRHRLERMQIFAAYLRQIYGNGISRRHQFAVVPRMGHYGRGTMTSQSGLTFLFAPLQD